jgi:hypothetical protein
MNKENMTIAEQLGVTEFPFLIKDSEYNIIYHETSYRHWVIKKFDSNGNRVVYKDACGYNEKVAYNEKVKFDHYYFSAYHNHGIMKKEQTIAQQLGVTEFPFTIKDANGNIIYREDSYGYWAKNEYDANDNEIYFENSTGLWCKREFDVNDNRIYSENSYGVIIDNRPQTKEIEAAIKLLTDEGLLVDGKILK